MILFDIIFAKVLKPCFFVIKYHITKHEILGLKKKLSKCSICYEKCENTRDLQEHIKTIHENTCHLCYKDFESDQELSNHISEEHKEKKKLVHFRYDYWFCLSFQVFRFTKTQRGKQTKK